MKKFFAVIFCAIIVASFSACGCNITISKADTETTQATTVAQTSKSESATKASTIMFDSIDDYLADPNVQSVLDTAKEQYKSLYDIDVYSEGDNVLVYEYKLLDQIPNDSLKTIKASLKSQMKSRGATLKPLMRELKGYVDVEHPEVKVKFINKDGTEIFDYTFDESILDEVEETTKTK